MPKTEASVPETDQYAAHTPFSKVI